MALYRSVITKHLADDIHVWSNVYTLQTASATDAMTTLLAFVDLEKAISYTTVEFLEASVVNKALRSDRKRQALSGTGVLSTTGLNGPLPLYVTVLVTFTDSVGKPERKYLRVGAQRDNLGAGVWDSTWLANLVTNYSSPLLGSLEYVGPSGERPTSQITSNIPQERQVGWHRRHRPGFHRGWVPNT